MIINYVLIKIDTGRNSRMRKKLITVILVVSLLTLVPTLAVSAKKPLIGTMSLQFDLDWFNDPRPDRPDWVGTITIDGEVYGMAFFVLGTGKPFGSDPSSSVHFFEEKFVIYFELEFEFDTDGKLIKFEEGAVAISGSDVGLTNMINSKYHMSGNVEVANGIFSAWIGRIVYMSGDISWYPNGFPHYAPGTLRLN